MLGRRPVEDRAALAGIVFVLKTGIACNQLPIGLVGCSGITCWRASPSASRAEASRTSPAWATALGSSNAASLSGLSAVAFALGCAASCAGLEAVPAHYASTMAGSRQLLRPRQRRGGVAALLSVRQPRRAQGRDSTRSPRGEAFILSVARWLGSYQVLAVQSIIVALWVGTNLVLSYHYFATHAPDCTFQVNGVTHVRANRQCSGLHPFDFYPFVLLNLAFSVQAAYAAPIILYAQNKSMVQDRRTMDAQKEAARAADEDLAFVAREIAAIRLSVAGGLSKSYAKDQVDRVLRARREARGGL